jgi:predicted RNA binding protein YcfA (HicA-like mRNA interferase family)
VTPHQPVVSGRRLIGALEADGWQVVRQRGSHVRLRHIARHSVLVVPEHDELKEGTLGRILREARIDNDELRRLLKE